MTIELQGFDNRKLQTSGEEPRCLFALIHRCRSGVATWAQGAERPEAGWQRAAKRYRSCRPTPQGVLVRTTRAQQIPVLPHAVAVAANVDGVAMVNQPVDQHAAITSSPGTPPHGAERRGVSGPHDSIGILLWRIARWMSGVDSRSVGDAPVDVKPCSRDGLDPWVESGLARPGRNAGRRCAGPVASARLLLPMISKPDRRYPDAFGPSTSPATNVLGLIRSSGSAGRRLVEEGDPPPGAGLSCFAPSLVPSLGPCGHRSLSQRPPKHAAYAPRVRSAAFAQDVVGQRQGHQLAPSRSRKALGNGSGKPVCGIALVGRNTGNAALFALTHKSAFLGRVVNDQPFPTPGFESRHVDGDHA